MISQCTFCKGTIEARTIRHVHEWSGEIYIFENVPAEVCTQCGEHYFAPETLKKIDGIVAGAEKADQHRSVPVYSL